MKKLQIKSVAVAASFACAGAVLAGTWTSPSTDALAPKHAAEALSASTALVVGSATYTMGVARGSSVAGGDMVIVLTPSTGSTFATTGGISCATWLPTIGGGNGSATIAVARGGASECAYTVAPTVAGLSTSSTINFGNITFATHTLNTSGNSVGVNLNLWNSSESSRVDNAAAVARTLATSVTSLTMTAAADTDTVTDVAFTSTAAGAVPLGGFSVTGGLISDTATAARAGFTIGNNAANTAMSANIGLGSFNYASITGPITVTVTGDFSGLSGVTVQTAAGGAITSTPVVTINAAKTSATFTLAAGDLGAAGTTTGFNLVATTAGTATLGTRRVFGVAGSAAPSGATAVSLAGNASWWTWSANAVQLVTPFFNTDGGSGVNTRFFFQNISSAPVTYSAVCSGESGVTVNNTAAGATGSTHTGSLVVGTTAILARDICSFGSVTGASAASGRGSIVFTINTASSNVKGVYNLGANGGGNAYIPLNRPYSGNSD